MIFEWHIGVCTRYESAEVEDRHHDERVARRRGDDDEWDSIPTTKTLLLVLPHESSARCRHAARNS